MHAAKPGSLPPAEVAECIAFLLEKSECTAGQTALPTDLAARKAIKFVSPMP